MILFSIARCASTARLYVLICTVYAGLHHRKAASATHGANPQPESEHSAVAHKQPSAAASAVPAEQQSAAAARSLAGDVAAGPDYDTVAAQSAAASAQPAWQDPFDDQLPSYAAPEYLEGATAQRGHQGSQEPLAPSAGTHTPLFTGATPMNLPPSAGLYAHAMQQPYGAMQWPAFSALQAQGQMEQSAASQEQTAIMSLLALQQAQAQAVAQAQLHAQQYAQLQVLMQARAQDYAQALAHTQALAQAQALAHSHVITHAHAAQSQTLAATASKPSKPSTEDKIVEQQRGHASHKRKAPLLIQKNPTKRVRSEWTRSIRETRHANEQREDYSRFAQPSAPREDAPAQREAQRPLSSLSIEEFNKRMGIEARAQKLPLTATSYNEQDWRNEVAIACPIPEIYDYLVQHTSGDAAQPTAAGAGGSAESATQEPALSLNIETYTSSVVYTPHTLTFIRRLPIYTHACDTSGNTAEDSTDAPKGKKGKKSRPAKYTGIFKAKNQRGAELNDAAVLKENQVKMKNFACKGLFARHAAYVRKRIGARKASKQKSSDTPTKPDDPPADAAPADTFEYHSPLLVENESLRACIGLNLLLSGLLDEITKDIFDAMHHSLTPLDVATILINMLYPTHVAYFPVAASVLYRILCKDDSSVEAMCTTHRAVIGQMTLLVRSAHTPSLSSQVADIAKCMEFTINKIEKRLEADSSASIFLNPTARGELSVLWHALPAFSSTNLRIARLASSSASTSDKLSNLQSFKEFVLDKLPPAILELGSWPCWLAVLRTMRKCMPASSFFAYLIARTPPIFAIRLLIESSYISAANIRVIFGFWIALQMPHVDAILNNAIFIFSYSRPSDMARLFSAIPVHILARMPADVLAEFSTRLLMYERSSYAVQCHCPDGHIRPSHSIAEFTAYLCAPRSPFFKQVPRTLSNMPVALRSVAHPDPTVSAALQILTTPATVPKYDRAVPEHAIFLDIVHRPSQLLWTLFALRWTEERIDPNAVELLLANQICAQSLNTTLGQLQGASPSPMFLSQLVRRTHGNNALFAKLAPSFCGTLTEEEQKTRGELAAADTALGRNRGAAEESDNAEDEDAAEDPNDAEHDSDNDDKMTVDGFVDDIADSAPTSGYTGASDMCWNVCENGNGVVEMLPPFMFRQILPQVVQNVIKSSAEQHGWKSLDVLARLVNVPWFRKCMAQIRANLERAYAGTVHTAIDHTAYIASNTSTEMPLPDLSARQLSPGDILIALFKKTPLHLCDYVEIVSALDEAAFHLLSRAVVPELDYASVRHIHGILGQILPIARPLVTVAAQRARQNRSASCTGVYTLLNPAHPTKMVRNALRFACYHLLAMAESECARADGPSASQFWPECAAIFEWLLNHPAAQPYLHKVAAGQRPRGRPLQKERAPCKEISELEEHITKAASDAATGSGSEPIQQNEALMSAVRSFLELIGDNARAQKTMLDKLAI